MEYWHPTIIMGIARAIGTPIKIDNNSLTGQFGHFARVLVEVDLISPLQEQVMLEQPGHCGFVTITYERLPEFCPHCSIIGHSVSNCKRQRTKEAPQIADTLPQRGRSQEKQIYRQK